MDRREAWPDFRPEWILYDDGTVVAVNKPAGVPSQAADPRIADDVVVRLSRFLEARDGDRPYLGVHQRLDRDTSGVLLYARRREANASLARQFEGRTVIKEYVAVASGWRGGGRTLRGRIVRGDGGRMRVAGKGAARGRPAVTHVEVLERRGARALLALRIETGRTHQIRVQLAAAGAPVDGDAAYGGAAAPRLMLHARVLRLEHPVSGEDLEMEAPVPEEMRRWMERGAPADLRDRGAVGQLLSRAAEARWGLARPAAEGPEPTTCFRLVHGAGDGLPGLCADVYGDHLVAHLYREVDDAVLDRVLDALASLGFDGVYLKRHPRQASVVVDAVAAGLAPPEPVRGVAAPDPLVVYEHGLPLQVRLGHGLGTGLFLDQRDNRARVRKLARGRSVLNLFAHTCAFTVAAAAGGARRTVSVDASAAALDRGRAQLEAFDPDGDHALVRADVFTQLAAEAKAGRSYDVVLVDPPTYSTTRVSRWRSGADWRRLAADAFRVTAEGGTVLACSNDRRMPSAKLRRHLHEGARQAGRAVARMRDLPVPRDFPAPCGEPPHLKSVLVHLE
ncbi:MAG: class I SAM-dependent methyltransferase [Myxococcota bacterium]